LINYINSLCQQLALITNTLFSVYLIINKIIGTPPQQQQQELPTAVQVPTKAANTDSNNAIIQNMPKLLAPSDDKKMVSKPNFKDASTSDDTQSHQANVAMDLGASSDGSVEGALVAKLQWASRELASAMSVEDSTQLCLLIKACAEALKSVRELDSSRPHASILKIQSDTNN
jgi:hypothetical protein